MRIKEILKEKGITAKELADRIGISQPAVSFAINGNPTVETLTKIADALGVSVSELFKRPADDDMTGICPHCGRPIKVTLE